MKLACWLSNIEHTMKLPDDATSESMLAWTSDWQADSATTIGRKKLVFAQYELVTSTKPLDWSRLGSWELLDQNHECMMDNPDVEARVQYVRHESTRQTVFQLQQCNFLIL